jgi:hypothetical protein
MKPLNLDNKPCSPISSNCVIWQGPDIPCINLCTGDTVSDVVAKLAEELCCILNILDINSYDLSCFNINQSKPEDFKAFIQFLTEKICELENLPTTFATTGEGDDDCPSGCIVTVAEPFQEDDRTTMNLTEYSLAMGNKIAENIDEINVNKTAIANHEVRITGLEVAPPPTFTLPSITPDCVLAGVPTPIDQVLEALESDYCVYVSNVGSVSDVTLAIARECAGLATSPSKSNPTNTMATEYVGTWVNTPSTLAQSVNNLWITLCDLRDANVTTVSVVDTDTINLGLAIVDSNYEITAQIQDTGWQDLQGFDYYPLSIPKPQVRKIGKTLQFRGQVYIPLSNDGGTTLEPLLAATSYYDRYFVAPFTGAGGVTLDSNGAIYFNQNTPVIPVDVLSIDDQLDSNYKKTEIIATRALNLDVTYGTALSAYGSLTLTADKRLIFQTLKDLEITATTPSGYKGSSALRFVTSYVRSGEYVPNYIGTNTDIHNAPSNADFPLTSETRNITWPLSCDAAEETDLGGFTFLLDGLTAYID